MLVFIFGRFLVCVRELKILRILEWIFLIVWFEVLMKVLFVFVGYVLGVGGWLFGKCGL